MVDLLINDKHLKNVELVIFDRDGTLIDLYHYWAQMIDQRAGLICRHYGLADIHKDKLMFEMGVDVANKKLRPEGPVGIKRREIVMQASIVYLSALGIKESQSVCTEIFKEVDRQSENNLNKLIKPLDGALKLINRLHGLGCKLAIATTDKTERARLSLDFLGLTAKFDYIIGADAVEHSKPATDMVEAILAALKVPKERALMVGDAATDIEMGRNANLQASIAVCTGITPRAQLEQLTDLVVDDISKIEIWERSVHGA